MERTRHCLLVCLLSCGLISPAAASVFTNSEWAGRMLCVPPASADHYCTGVAMPGAVGDPPVLGLAAQSMTATRGFERSQDAAGGTGQGPAWVTELVAALLAAEAPIRVSSAHHQPMSLWVLASGILGAAFVARRRKPAIRRAGRPALRTH